jgi:hypothetical protein
MSTSNKKRKRKASEVNVTINNFFLPVAGPTYAPAQEGPEHLTRLGSRTFWTTK